MADSPDDRPEAAPEGLTGFQVQVAQVFSVCLPVPDFSSLEVPRSRPSTLSRARQKTSISSLARDVATSRPHAMRSRPPLSPEGGRFVGYETLPPSVGSWSPAQIIFSLTLRWTACRPFRPPGA